MIRNLGIGLLCLLAASLAPLAGAGAAGQKVELNIPAQPLAQALDEFTAETGTQLLYRAGLAADRRSAEVRGAFTQDAALDILLTGTGLEAERTDTDAFVLMPKPPTATAAGTVPPDARFLGALQRRMREALCASPETRPGDYQLGVQFWFTPSGAVQKVTLIGSTGSLARDRSLTQALGGLISRIAPLPRMAQPVTMVLARRSSRGGDECDRP